MQADDRQTVRFLNAKMPIAVNLLLAAAAVMPSAAGSPRDVPQRPAQSSGIHLSYTLSLLGIPFGHMDYAAAVGPERYGAEMHFHTSGLAAALWKSQIDASAKGRMVSGALLPDLYTSQSLSRYGRNQSVRVDYTAAGGPVMVADPPYDLSKYPVSDAQKKGAVDPLTAIASIVAGPSTSATRPCGAKEAVFDGRRRYDIVFTFLRSEPSASADIGGNPRVCEAEYRQLAGIKQEVVDVSAVPTIYSEFVDLPARSRHYTVARSIWSSFLWGAVRARLASVTIDNRPVLTDQ